MITNQHNDGGCFRLTVTYYQIADGTESEHVYRNYIMFGEDEEELFAHYLEVRHLWAGVSKIEIMDDSK